MNELGADTLRDENEKLDRHLRRTLTSLQKSENNDGSIEAIKKAQEALRQEMQAMELDSDAKDPKSSRCEDERIKENRRLHHKLQDIQKGKGRKKPDDPEGLSRWWVTSPRGKDKTEYQRERQKLMEDLKIQKEKKRIEREKEEKELMKKKQEESQKEKEKLPEGYRKKRRKKKSVIDDPDMAGETKEEEELPDVSILSKDPYNENNDGASRTGKGETKAQTKKAIDKKVARKAKKY